MEAIGENNCHIHVTGRKKLFAIEATCCKLTEIPDYQGAIDFDGE
jgi:hypothetical protein